MYLPFLVVGMFIARAQESFSVKGFVEDEEGNSIVVGDVLLYKDKSADIDKYTFVYDGKFEFESLEKGNYILKISALGYAIFERQIKVDKSTELNIILKTEVERLNEVEVVSIKSPFSIKNGDIKIDVQNPAFLSIADPLDILGKIPTVQLSPDKQSISVIGKGNPLLYIENQQIGIEEFAALPVDAILSIELLKNPSSKYGANGRAVVMVTLKKDSSSIRSATLSETTSFKHNFNNYFSANFMVPINKSSLRANLAYNDLGQWESHTFQFDIPFRKVFTDYLVLIPLNKRKQINSGLGFFHPFKRNGHFSFNTIYKKQTDDSPIKTNTFLENDGQEDDILTDTDNDKSTDYLSTNLNFEKTLAKNIELFTGLQYSSFIQTLDTEISNDFNGDGFKLGQTRNQEYQLNSYAFRLDLEHRISKNHKLELGLNWNEARASAYNKIEEVNISEPKITDFDYNENLVATYTSITGNIGKAIDYEVGLRVETNQVKSALEGNVSPLVERKNTRLFPKSKINIVLDSTKTLTLNYAQSIKRPNFSRTSNISVYINPFLEGRGNINLRPSYTGEVSANLQWAGKSFSVGHYRTTDLMNFTIDYDGESDLAVLSQVNLERETGFYVGAVFPFNKGIWTSNTSVNLNYNKMNDSDAFLQKAKPYVYVSSNHQFKVAKDTLITIGGWAMTQRQEGIIKRNAMVVANASITQSFLKNFQGSLRLNDIFKQMNFKESYTINGVKAKGTYFVDAYEIAFSVKYSFSKGKKNRFKNKDVDENLKRI